MHQPMQCVDFHNLLIFKMPYLNQVQEVAVAQLCMVHIVYRDVMGGTTDLLTL